MAKKVVSPVEMSVEDRLKALYQLQTTLTAIDEKRALRGELPLEVQDLEDELAGLATRIENIKAEIEEINAAMTEKRNGIEVAQSKIEQYKLQLNDVRNNREYDAFSKEIEYQTLEIELCNKKLREGKARIEQKSEELARTQETLTGRRTDLEIKRTELDEIMEETRAEEEMLKAKAADLETLIEPRLLLSFKRIRKNVRNGLAVVPVQRDACGGCFAQIPPQRQLDIKMHKKIIVCEYCGRILVDPELAGLKVEKEEKPAKRTKRTTKKAAVVDTVEEDKIED